MKKTSLSKILSLSVLSLAILFMLSAIVTADLGSTLSSSSSDVTCVSMPNCASGYHQAYSGIDSNGCKSYTCEKDVDVCCEIFGYGAMMVKTASTYQIMPGNECSTCTVDEITGIGNCITGGGRNIVDNKYCTQTACVFTSNCAEGDIPVDTGSLDSNGCKIYTCNTKTACTMPVCSDGLTPIDTGKIEPNGCKIYACNDQTACTVPICSDESKPIDTGKIDSNGCKLYTCNDQTACAMPVCSDGLTPIDSGEIEPNGCKIYACKTDTNNDVCCLITEYITQTATVDQNNIESCGFTGEKCMLRSTEFISKDKCVNTYEDSCTTTTLDNNVKQETCTMTLTFERKIISNEYCESKIIGKIRIADQGSTTKVTNSVEPITEVTMEATATKGVQAVEVSVDDKKAVLAIEKGWNTITVDGEKAMTKETIMGNKEGISMKTESGDIKIKYLPMQASERAFEAVGKSATEVVLVEKDGKAVYESQVTKEVKVLGLIRAHPTYTITVDATTGIVEVDKPWYTAISKVVDETSNK